jgi:hypothetical protein
MSLARLFVCMIPCSVGGTSRTTPSASFVCIEVACTVAVEP